MNHIEGDIRIAGSTVSALGNAPDREDQQIALTPPRFVDQWQNCRGVRADRYVAASLSMKHHEGLARQLGWVSRVKVSEDEHEKSTTVVDTS